jgi:hypothetical protein
MEKGHYGHYSGNARHSRVTNHNMDATKRDDEAHMEYLKEDVKYDNKHGHSDSSMTADEKHISKLAGDLKYDEKHHGSARHDGTDNNHNGDIRQSPSKFTQVVRRFKNDQTGPFSFARNLAATALALAPVPFGKVKAVKNITSAFGNTSKQYLRGKNMTKIPNPIPEKNIGGFREFANPKLRDHFNKVPKSKPVEFMGPNPAHKIGAGGNSYPR